MDEWLQRPWVIVGCGRLGRTIGLAAEANGIELRATWNRTEQTAEQTVELLSPGRAVHGPLPEAIEELDLSRCVVWVSVVDDVIAEISGKLAPSVKAADLVLHACGSLDARVLLESGIEAPVGSLHPLLAITDPEQAIERLGECVWTVEGGSEAVDFAGAFTTAIGARLLEVESGSRALYHASAATAANLFVALFDVALEMAERAGVGREDARDMLLPLVESSVANLKNQSTAEALSGPSARGDLGTIERHREALRATGADLDSIYEVLTRRALKLGEGEG